MRSTLALFPFFLLIFIYGPLILLGIACYCMRGWALYTMAKNTNMQNPWYGWVPVMQQYLIGQMADRYLAWRGKRTRYALWNAILFGSAIAASLLLIPSIIGILGVGLSLPGGWSMLGLYFFVLVYVVLFLTSIASTVVLLISCYHVYNDFEPKNVLPFILLELFGFGFISMFMIRDNVPVGIAGQHPHGQPKYQHTPQART